MASTKDKKNKNTGVTKMEIEEIPTMDKLSPDHLLQIEVKSRDIENAKLHMALDEQALKNMLLEIQILQRKVEDQKLLLKQRANFYDNNVKQFQQLKAELWPQYGLTQNEGLGYDPATGVIHRTNNN